MQARFMAVLVVVGFSLSAGAAVSSVTSPSPRCYSITIAESPEASSAATFGRRALNKERWCYWDQSQDGRDFTLIFNADADSIKPELSALVEWTSQHRIRRITHGSLFRGNVTIHRSLVTAVNPLPISLDERTLDARALRTSESITSAQLLQAFHMIRSFQQARVPEFRPQITEGTFTAMLDDNQLPYKGYWWPFATVDLGAGPHSPLGKYDTIVGRLTGSNPGSAAWEAANHSTTAVAWGGHCNGWAASSVLYPEFTKYLWDQPSQQVLFPSDIKGILTEASFCVSYAFYGHRYNGNPGDDLLDIYPDLFHQTLVYYLSEVKKPVAFDYERDVPVDNNVITGYTMTIAKEPGVPNEFHVVADLRVHNYQGKRDEEAGAARLRPRTYEYTLDVDDNGNIVKGTWISDNPDFLWVPLSPKQDCPGKNPKLDLDQIQKLMTTLPEAKSNTVALGFNWNQPLAPQQQVSIKIPAMKGSLFKVAIQGNTFTDGTLEIVAQGLPAYPTVDPGQRNPVSLMPVFPKYDGEITYADYIDPSATSTFEIPLTDISSLSLLNNADDQETSGQVVLDHIDFYSGDSAQ